MDDIHFFFLGLVVVFAGLLTVSLISEMALGLILISLGAIILLYSIKLYVS